MMDEKINQFINFLFSIGLINAHSSKELFIIYNKNKLLNPESSIINSNSSLLLPSKRSSELNYSLKDLMQTILFEFLLKQDASSMQTIAFDIVQKYTESTFMTRTKASKKLYNVYFKYNVILRKKYLNLWKINMKKRWKTATKSPYNILSTEAKKEHDSLMSCTFKPKINKSSRSLNKYKSVSGYTNNNPFSRLYLDHEIYKNKRDLKKEEMLKKESKLLRSTPKLMSSCISSNYNYNNALLSKSFNERLEVFENKKNKNKDRILRDSEELENMLFTFTPSINKSSLTIDIPAHNRLYNDFKRRAENNDLRQKEVNDNINRLCLNTTYQSKKPDINRLESLYYNYKIQQKKKKELLKEVEKEEGLTFKPILTENPIYYNPKSPLYGNIFERNQKYLEGKRIKTEEALHTELNRNSKSPKVYSKEDYINNLKHIEEKLYMPGKKKQILRFYKKNDIEERNISIANNEILGLRKYDKRDKKISKTKLPLRIEDNEFISQLINNEEDNKRYNFVEKLNI